jgi:hypothetical protein
MRLVWTLLRLWLCRIKINVHEMVGYRFERFEKGGSLPAGWCIGYVASAKTALYRRVADHLSAVGAALKMLIGQTALAEAAHDRCWINALSAIWALNKVGHLAPFWKLPPAAPSDIRAI